MYLRFLKRRHAFHLRICQLFGLSVIDGFVPACATGKLEMVLMNIFYYSRLSASAD